MLILAVDTGTQAGSLAVLRDDRVAGVVSTKSDEGYSSRLFRQLELLLAETDVELPDIDLFAVAAGPGSFTGLRVGLTAVKGWAEVFRRPIAAVSGLEAIASLARSAQEAQLLAPVLDARRGQVFSGLYEQADGTLRRRGDEIVMPFDEVFLELSSRLRNETVLFVTPEPDLLRAALEISAFRGGRIEEVSSVLAPAVGRLGLARFRRGELTDALSLDANYVRRSDAELLWKDRP